MAEGPFKAVERGNKCVFSAWEHVEHKRGIETELQSLRRSYGLANGFGMALKVGGGVRLYVLVLH